MADVLGQEGRAADGERSVPMDKVVMLIWQFRDDPTVVTFMARFVAKVSCEIPMGLSCFLLLLHRIVRFHYRHVSISRSPKPSLSLPASSVRWIKNCL